MKQRELDLHDRSARIELRGSFDNEEEENILGDHDGVRLGQGSGTTEPCPGTMEVVTLEYGLEHRNLTALQSRVTAAF